MASRVAALSAQLAAGRASDSDVLIVSGARTAITRAKRGAFKDTTPDVLLRTVLKAAVERACLSPGDIEDICVGNVLQPGSGAVMARMAQFQAGIPHTTSLSTVNRQCSSGLQAIANICGAIQTGAIGIGIGAGVESMSLNSMTDVTPTVDWETVYSIKDAVDSTVSMGITSENVAERYGISRDQQDLFSVRSHKRATASATSGSSAEEIVQVQVDGGVVDKDEGYRSDVAVEKLATLKPAFKDGGTTTAGNSSQMSDGAAAVVIVRRDIAQARGLRALGVMRSYAVVGVPPDEMGVGPAFAIPEALAKAGLSVRDIDVFEINEAFASQLIYCVGKLGLAEELARDSDRINPVGGAIALGHPLGCTGSRQVVTLLHYLRRTNKRFGIVSMCIGTGMGMAAVFENEAAPARSYC
jgi:acetyl-CoA acyltransferase 1